MEKTLNFLADLKSNNEQAWFVDHLAEYEGSKSELNEFTYLLLNQLSLIDDKLDPEKEIEKFITTIFNKRPKKEITYFGFFDVSISPLDNDGNEPVYLVHIEPNHQSYISIKYVPDVFGLQVMRNYISKNIFLFENVLQEAYASGFVLEESTMLPTLPKGYPIGTQGEAYIRLKEYEVRSPIDLLKDKNELLKDLHLTFEAGLPLIQFLRKGLGL